MVFEGEGAVGEQHEVASHVLDDTVVVVVFDLCCSLLAVAAIGDLHIEYLRVIVRS